jgi:hypothetical protein
MLAWSGGNVTVRCCLSLCLVLVTWTVFSVLSHLYNIVVHQFTASVIIVIPVACRNDSHITVVNLKWSGWSVTAKPLWCHSVSAAQYTAFLEQSACNEHMQMSHQQRGHVTYLEVLRWVEWNLAFSVHAKGALSGLILVYVGPVQCVLES